MKRRAGAVEGGTTLLLHAIRFAAEQHRDHRRKGSIAAPYINHPIAVAEQLAGAGLQDDVEMLAAAVLHDVVEDAGISRRRLAREFGERVACIVLEVTDDTTLKARDRKRHTVESIARKSEAARLIKLSDLIANVYDVIHHPPHWSRERTLNYLEWAEQVVAEIRGIHPQLEALFDDCMAQARSRDDLR